MPLFLSRLANLALDLIFPRRCAHCARVSEGSIWCPSCVLLVQTIPYICCPGCGLRSPSGRTCERCKARVRITGLIVPFLYALPPIRHAILQFKFEGVTVNADELSNSITQYMRVHTPPLFLFVKNDALVVPVPLSRKRFLERGFNQAALIATCIAHTLGLNARTDILAREKDTCLQTSFTSEHERRANVAGAFAVINSANIRGKTVLLVDDVYTTGATMAECTRVLRHAGARAVWGVAIARG